MRSKTQTLKSFISEDFVNLSDLESLPSTEVVSFDLVKGKWQNCSFVFKPTAKPVSFQGPQTAPRRFSSLPQQPMSIGERSAKGSNITANLVPNLPTSPLPLHQVAKNVSRFHSNFTWGGFVDVKNLSSCSSAFKPSKAIVKLFASFKCEKRQIPDCKR
jgi:hypothetical protein